MEYVYSAMLLHSAKQDVTEDKVTKILQAAGAHPDSSRVKALIASLKDINIDDAISKAAVVQAAAPVAVAEAKHEGKKAEEAAAGLSALVG